MNNDGINCGPKDCDCDEDNKCGCSFPNNITEFSCGCTPESNCGCIELEATTVTYLHNDNKCTCSGTAKSE